MSSFQISAVEMKNIKSYFDERIEFGDGITIISGENGAGKSTIFEAVGHCLFGVSPSKFIGKADKFLRAGERNGSVIVYFKAKNDVNGSPVETEYRVEKNIRGETVLQKKNPDGGWGSAIETGVTQEIQKLMNLSGPTALDQMFTDIIGPFQSEFITPFLMSGVKRKDHFDQILGISGWKELNEKTSFLDNRFKDKIKALEFEASTMEKTIESLPVKEEKLKNDTEQKKELENSIASLKNQIDEVGKKIGELTSLKTSLDTKKTLESKTTGEQEGDKKLLETKLTDLGKAKESFEIVRKAKPGYDVHIECSGIKKKLEAKQREKTELFRKKAEKEKSIAGTEQSIISGRKHYTEDKVKREKEIEENIAQIKETDSQLAVCTEGVNECRNKLEAVRKVLEKVRSVDIDIISRKSENVKSLLQRISSLEKSIANRREALKEKESLQKESEKLHILETELERINDEISAAKTKISQYKKGKEGLSQGLCPYMGEKCLNLKDWDSDEFFNTKIEELKNRIKIIESDKKIMEVQKKDAQSAGQKLAGLTKEEKELLKELAEVERIGIEIRQALIKSELEELSGQMAVFSENYKEEEIQATLANLNKNLNEFTFPDELTRFPSILENIFRIFEECRNSIILQIKKQENDASSILEQEVQNKSSLDTRQKKLKSDNAKLSKELKKIIENLAELDNRENILKKEKTALLSLEDKLKSYDGLDNEISQIDEKLTGSKYDHDLYMSHLKDSRQVGDLIIFTDELKKNIASRESSLKVLMEEITLLSAKFHQVELDKAHSDFSNLKEKFGEDRKDLANTIREIESLGKEITAMKETQKMIKERKVEIIQYRKSQEFAGFLRKNIIGKIAEEIAQDYRREISAIAGRIYRDISGNNNREELIWGDGYSIILRDKDMGKGKLRERIDRQLSGGQFMTAVIAIRMALLEIIGSTLAFFDEPTSNLDEEHRRNLADVFRRLDQKTDDRWFNQLFLVSHDESFEGITRHHIRLRLDEKAGSVVDSGILPEVKHVTVPINLS